MRHLHIRILSLVFICIGIFSVAGQVYGLGETTQNLLTPTLSEPLPGAEFNFTTIGDDQRVPWIGDYVKALFRFGLILASTLAVVMIMAGGFLWLTAGGQSERIGTAKELIKAALLGLVMTLLSYLLLVTINPRLVALEPIGLNPIEAPAEGEAACMTAGEFCGAGSTQSCCSGLTCVNGGCVADEDVAFECARYNQVCGPDITCCSGYTCQIEQGGGGVEGVCR